MMLERHYAMPFGAEVLPGGGVRFRLWAPAADGVELELGEGGGRRRLPMERRDEGWYHLETDRAGPGDLYRYRIGELAVPDPASRFQPRDVHGPSEVIDPHAWQWQDSDWPGRPWREAVLYELHVGSFTPQGTFRAAIDRLDHLVALGVTAIELMPLADFPGRRNWGYDGVFLFAPESRYGRPEDLKALVEAGHRRGLMVFLDVVYNHFGPEGNYLHHYAPQFFTERHHTPWGAAINFDGADSHWVRQFFIDNACYWLHEYHLDGLRLDAVHAICDDSRPDILEDLAAMVREKVNTTRHVHLVLENDNNAAHYLREATASPAGYVAQWNDDLHHVLHVLITGETAGYYVDFGSDPLHHLGRALTEGFVYQDDPSTFRHGRRRGEPSRGLPPTRFVGYLQNHDQVGNRAFGERITALATPEAVRAATALVLLAPSPPLLFMGQEWGARQPFLFFCDLGGDLAPLVVEGRREEFASFPEFRSAARRGEIPDPLADETFARACLAWHAADTPEGRHWLDFHRRLLTARRADIVPRLPAIRAGEATWERLAGTALRARWPTTEGGSLTVLANLSAHPVSDVKMPSGRLLFATHDELAEKLLQGELPAWTVAWFLDDTPTRGPGS
jgi:1,4-alpha-glucan branching enzyme/maltooligosyltrehalose trehalohydrolase